MEERTTSRKKSKSGFDESRSWMVTSPRRSRVTGFTIRRNRWINNTRREGGMGSGRLMLLFYLIRPLAKADTVSHSRMEIIEKERLKIIFSAICV
jgi:hypothetical protein